MDRRCLLARLLRESNEPLEIIATGALTNIAAVTKAEPQLRRKISRITTMGGAVDVPGNLRVHGFTENHPNTKAEWNYYIDPQAARSVFQSGIPIRLFPLDATNNVPLTDTFVQRVKESPASPLQAFAARLLDRIRQSTNNGEYYHWDPLAAVTAIHPEVCVKAESRRLTIDTNTGKDYGLLTGRPWQAFPHAAFNGKARVALGDRAGSIIESATANTIDVCLHANAATFESRYLGALRPP